LSAGVRLQELNSLAQDRRRWKLITRQTKQCTPIGAGPMVPEEEEDIGQNAIAKKLGQKTHGTS